jgi:hypothetical protein
MTAFDIVVNPVGSGFAKALQTALRTKVKNPIFRRATPKVLPARRTIVSKRGNVLRQGRSQSIRQHFTITTGVLNKIQQLNRFKDANVSCPKFTTSVGELASLESKTIFARTLVNATNGRGIVEFDYPGERDYPNAPLYTEYIKKKSEYRFHVFNGAVIDVQEKRKKAGVEERNTRVRNVHNGYVYCRDGVVPPAGAADLAVRAVGACGYHYGAVDMVFNEKRGQCYVLEVNSRPGLMGTTLDKYAEALIEEFKLDRR